MKREYDRDFYSERHRKTLYSARKILSIVVDALPEVDSAADFGCGVGTWLSVLREQGVRDILGMDGPWVEGDLLEIPEEDFRRIDFEEFTGIDGRYDLAISLEVAEHLSENRAPGFIGALTDASDFVLFSAAIPFQAGRFHVNERWPDYWAGLFAERGYVPLDFIRGMIWNDEGIPFWYRQNTLLFVREQRLDQVDPPKSELSGDGCPISLVHPNIYLDKAARMVSVRGTWRLFRQAIGKWLRKKLRLGP